MLIAQMTDVHALPRGKTLEGVDTNEMLRRAITHLTELRPAPDIVLITGDLAEGGGDKSYLTLREELAHLDIPHHVIVGNHDRRDGVRRAFGNHCYLPASGPLHCVVEDYPVRLIGLDTLDEGRGGGKRCAGRLKWIERTLAAEPNVPTMIFMHHPPFDTGIGWMDASEFRGAAAFEALVKRHPQIRRIICGHLHRPITSVVGGIHASVAPSTCYQVHLDLAPQASPHIILEPPACHLHMWDGVRFVTHESYICRNVPPIELCRASSTV